MECRSERRRKTACYRLCAQVCVHWETRTRCIRTEAASMTSPVRQESKAETRSPLHQHQRDHNPRPPRPLERLPSYCRGILLLLLLLLLLLVLLPLLLVLLLLLFLCHETSSLCLKLPRSTVPLLHNSRPQLPVRTVTVIQDGHHHHYHHHHYHHHHTLTSTTSR